MRSYTEYIVNLKAPKHILQQTYRVHIFLGEFESDLKTWHTQHALVGTFSVFGRNTTRGSDEETGCGKCKKDAEDGLIGDIDECLEKLAPFRENYRHHRTGETNGDAHLKSLLVHHEVIVPVTAGKLDFGPWQQVYYAEFDGQRPKRVIIKVMGE